MTKEKENWREEFDRTFTGKIGWIGAGGSGGGMGLADIEIKFFISQLLSSKHQELRREVDGMMKEGVGGDGDGGWENFKGSWDEFNEAYGHNSALSQVLEVIDRVYGEDNQTK